MKITTENFLTWARENFSKLPLTALQVANKYLASVNNSKEDLEGELKALLVEYGAVEK